MVTKCDGNVTMHVLRQWVSCRCERIVIALTDPGPQHRKIDSLDFDTCPTQSRQCAQDRAIVGALARKTMSQASRSRRSDQDTRRDPLLPLMAPGVQPNRRRNAVEKYWLVWKPQHSAT